MACYCCVADTGSRLKILPRDMGLQPVVEKQEKNLKTRWLGSSEYKWCWNAGWFSLQTLHDLEH